MGSAASENGVSRGVFLMGNFRVKDSLTDPTLPLSSQFQITAIPPSDIDPTWSQNFAPGRQIRPLKKSVLDREVSRRTVVKAVAAITGTAFGGTIFAGLNNLPEKIELGTGLVIPPFEKSIHFPENSGYFERKLDVLYKNMLKNFKAGNDLLYGKKKRGIKWWRRGYASVWAFGRAIDALYSMGLVPGIESQSNVQYLRRSSALENYWHTRSDGRPSSYDPGLPELRFGARDEALTDDNLWIGLMFMREYKRFHDPVLFERAREIFKTVVSQWDGDLGGVHWALKLKGEKNRDRGIVSNATAVMLGVELYKATEDSVEKEEYLEWSKKIFAWTDALKDRYDKNNLYSDRFFFDKEQRVYRVDLTKWTYVQGIMIGAMVKLSEIDTDHEKELLQNALTLADRSFAHFDERNRKNGRTMEVGDGYIGNAFNGIYFENLLSLAAKIGDPQFTSRVQYTLRDRVRRLGDDYDDLVDHAGAVHLTALTCIPEDRYKYLI